jgi:D-psicose/D-tagatose/L-ribulose 3-epimerase
LKIGFNLLVLGGHVTQDHDVHLKTLAALGYDGVEIPILEGEQEHYRALGARCQDLGLDRTAVTVIPPHLNPTSAERIARDEARDYLCGVIDNAHALDAKLICGPLYSPLGYFSGAGPTPDELGHAADTLRQAAEYAVAAGVTLVVEPLNRFETYVVTTVGQAADFSRRVSHPNLGFMHDTFHANIEELDPVAAFTAHATEFSHIHISENDRGIPGRGHAAIVPIIQHARETGYDGWMVVEAFGRAVPELAAATRVWRDLFPSYDVLFAESLTHIRQAWAAGGN